MRRLTRRLVVTPMLAVAAFAGAPALASASSCRGAGAAPASPGANAAHATLCLLNRERRSHGRRALRMNRRLSRAAAGHSVEMVAMHYFDHNSRSGRDFSSRIRRAGWMRGRNSWTVGENIGWGAGALATPRAMVSAWMHSAGHRDNILERRFRMIGIGIALGAPTGDANGATYSTDFGG